MNTLEKLELLSENCSDNTELDRIIGQLLNLILTRYRQKLAIYNLDIDKFEKKYNKSENNKILLNEYLSKTKFDFRKYL